MVREACPWTWHGGRLTLEIELPPHAVPPSPWSSRHHERAEERSTRRRAPTYGDDQLQTLQRNTFRYSGRKPTRRTG